METIITHSSGTGPPLDVLTLGPPALSGGFGRGGRDQTSGGLTQRLHTAARYFWGAVLLIHPCLISC